MVYWLSNKTKCLLLIVILATGCISRIPEEMVNEISKLPDKIDFNFHVKPILSDKCFACHGPDAKNRKANLRLDLNQKFIKDKHEFSDFIHLSQFLPCLSPGHQFRYLTRLPIRVATWN